MKYIVQDSEGKKMIMSVVASMPQLPEGFEVLGLADELPEIVAAMEAVSSKEAQVREAYEVMRTDVLAQMQFVFGTADQNSAAAYERTWNLMKTDPTDWVLLDLKDDEGNILDTEAKVVAFASSKLQAVLDYGKFRMQRIQQFKDEKASILAG